MEIEVGGEAGDVAEVPGPEPVLHVEADQGMVRSHT